MNIGSFIYDIFQRVVALVTDLGEFLAETITIGQWEVSFLGILGGVGAAVLIVYSILKS